MKFSCAIIAISFALAGVAKGQDLRELSEFATSVCDNVPAGRMTRTEISGGIRANLSWLAKLLGISSELSATQAEELYDGIPLSNLPSEIPTINQCRIEIIRIIMDRRPVSTPLVCRHKDFGIERWGSIIEHTDSSGRLGGGRDQPWWCAQVEASFLTNRGITSEHIIERVNSWEESSKDWKGKVTYKYHCTIRVKWNPIYFERQDAGRCGVASF